MCRALVAVVMAVSLIVVGGVVAGCAGESQVSPPQFLGQSGAEVDGPAVTVTLPGPAPAGALLVLTVSARGGALTSTDGVASGWAAAGRSMSFGSTRMQVLYGIADGRGDRVRVVADDSDSTSVSVRAYRNVSAAAPLVARTEGTEPARVRNGGSGLVVTASPGSSTPMADRIGDIADPSSASLPDLTPGAPAQTFVFAAGSAARPSRILWQQPFATTSIWNTAIGSAARYVPAGLPSVPGGDRFAPLPQADQTSIIDTPDAPATDLRYSSAAWTGRDRCQATGAVYARVPMPSDYVVPNSTDNEGASWRLAGGHAVVQSGPLARCARGGYATSVDAGDPLDLAGSGISTGLGGSGLSGMVGALRLGEMRRDTATTGPRHALRVNVDTDRQMRRCGDNDCFRWPASSADSDAASAYGRLGTAPQAMRLGALLAIPVGVDIDALGLRTTPGRQLAWTLQNYGAYVADSTACACFAIVTEKGPDGRFTDQFRDDYGVGFDQRAGSGSLWSQDVSRLQSVLAVVDDNGPQHVGGGGLPLQPTAPEAVER